MNRQLLVVISGTLFVALGLGVFFGTGCAETQSSTSRPTAPHTTAAVAYDTQKMASSLEQIKNSVDRIEERVNVQTGYLGQLAQIIDERSIRVCKALESIAKWLKERKE